LFNKHEKLHDEQNNIHSCDWCGYKTKNNPLFRDHLSNHKTEPNYFCVAGNCDLLFKRKNALRIHVQREHNDWF